MKILLGLIVFFVLVTIIATALFIYGRGYRLDLDERVLKPTGVLTIKSTPSDAKVFIDGEEQGSTNLDIPALSPGKYRLKIVREGFSPWEKQIEIVKEQVKEIEVLLFPIVPSLTSLTFTGVSNPIRTPNGSKIVFTITNNKDQSGIWLLKLSDNPLPIFFSENLTRVVSDTKDVKFSQGQMQVSPNSSQILVKINGNKPGFYLLNLNEENTKPSALLSPEVKSLTSGWQTQKTEEINDKIANLGKKAVDFSKNLTNIIISPDEKRFIGVNKEGNFVVFDSEPSPVPNTQERTYKLSKAKNFIWFPDSIHLIVVNKNSISIADVDGANNNSIYSTTSGIDFVAPWPDGSRIVTLANFNPNLTKLPNLYTVQLR